MFSWQVIIALHTPRLPEFPLSVVIHLRRLLPLRVFRLAGQIALLLWVLAPSRTPVLLTGPHTVQAAHDHVCVHTRLIEEVEEWKIQDTLEWARTMGASTIVEMFPWAYLQPSPEVFDWRQADRIVRHAQDQGLRVIARLGLVPAWAQEQGSDSPLTTLNTLPRAAFDDFATFGAAFAARYRGIIDHVIIWNEPNLAFEWGYHAVVPTDYADLLAVVAPAIRRANPDAVILGGALAPTLEPEGSPHGLDDLIYLERLYQAGAAEHFDALAVHTYGFTAPASAAPAIDQLNFRRVELLRAIMLRHGDENTPVYITESGWNDDPRWTKAVSPSQRVAYTLDAFALAEAWPWLETLCLWVFRTPAPTFSYPDHFTLLTPDFQPRAIYPAVQAYALGRVFEERLWLPPPTAPVSGS